MTTSTQSQGMLDKVFMVALAGLVISLAMGFWGLFSAGHGSFNTTSDGIVWGLPVAVYVYFALTSTGLTLVASLAMVFGFREFYPIAKRCVWLSLAVIVAGFASLAFEMGRPFLMLWAIPANLQLQSPLVWMGMFYLAFMVIGVLKFKTINEGDWDSAGSRRLGIGAMVAEVLAALTLGAAFGMMAMRPFWFGGMIPLYFLLTAFLSGITFAVLFTYLVHGFEREAMPENVKALLDGPVPVLFAATLGIYILALGARTITGLWSHQDGFQAFNWMVSSPLFHVELWLGLVLPFVLLANPGTRSQPKMQIAAAALVALALTIGRYEFVIGGQVVPMMKGSWMGDFVPYVPSLTEWMMALLAVSLTLTIYILGEKRLNLAAAPEK